MHVNNGHITMILCMSCFQRTAPAFFTQIPIPTVVVDVKFNLFTDIKRIQLYYEVSSNLNKHYIAYNIASYHYWHAIMTVHALLEDDLKSHRLLFKIYCNYVFLTKISHIFVELMLAVDAARELFSYCWKSSCATASNNVKPGGIGVTFIAGWWTT